MTLSDLERRIQGLPKVFKYPLLSQELVNLTDLKFGRYINIKVHPNKSPLKISEKRERGRIQGLPKFFKYPLLSQKRVKLYTDFKFGQYIHRVHPNKNPFKILEKMEREHIWGLPIVYPFISGTGKATSRTSNFRRTFTGSIASFATKAH